MGKVLGAVLFGFAGLGALLVAPAARADAEGRPDVRPGELVERAGTGLWRACGAQGQESCRQERGVVWVLPSAQVLTDSLKEVRELRLLTQSQQQSLEIMSERLALAQEKVRLVNDHLLIASDALKAASTEHKRMSLRVRTAEAELQSARLRWFCFGAAAAVVLIGGGALTVVML